MHVHTCITIHARVYTDTYAHDFSIHCEHITLAHRPIPCFPAPAFLLTRGTLNTASHISTLQLSDPAVFSSAGEVLVCFSEPKIPLNSPPIPSLSPLDFLPALHSGNITERLSLTSPQCSYWECGGVGSSAWPRQSLHVPVGSLRGTQDPSSEQSECPALAARHPGLRPLGSWPASESHAAEVCGHPGAACTRGIWWCRVPDTWGRMHHTDDGVPSEDVPVEDVEGQVAEASWDLAVEILAVEGTARRCHITVPHTVCACVLTLHDLKGPR